jgi:hypothetical protein
MNSNTEQTADLTPEKRRELLAELLKNKARAARVYSHSSECGFWINWSRATPSTIC